jgi:ABC-2 type transport system ATP-binding protein
MSETAILIEDLTHDYGDHRALDAVSLSIERGEIFGLLGPNGSGKTTLFRILSTLVRPASGTARIFGNDVQREADAARRRMGVVFQRPSVDGKLTVAENLHHHGRLYGIPRGALAERSRSMMERLGLADRAADRVDTLSGGLQRRVELAKALLHRPELLVLDEPSTGLDPAARREFLRYLEELRTADGVTVVLTTHYLEEAERCDRVGILHRGRLIGLGKPDELKASVGGDVVVIHPQDAGELQRHIRSRFGCEVSIVDGTLRAERPRGHEFIRELVEAFPAEVKSVTFGKPTLEDVFVHLTGARFWGGPTSNGDEHE